MLRRQEPGLREFAKLANPSAVRATNFVVKPFVYEELVARMRAVLRRAVGPARRDRLAVGEIEIDRLSRTVRVAGEPVALSAKEYELLVALAEEPERVFRKEELLRDVWGFRSLGRTRTLDSHASRLRRKLNNGGSSAYVINVLGEIGRGRRNAAGMDMPPTG